MAWGTVAAFTDNEVVTAAKLNQLADNIEYLRASNEYVYLYNSTEMTTTSGTFVSLGANFEQAAFACTGRPILVLLQGSVRVSGAGSEIGNFDIEVDGSRIGHSTDGLVSVQRETNAGSVVTTPPYHASIGAIITGLAAGNHAFKMMWAVEAGGTLKLGYGSGAVKFCIREL